MIPVDEEANTVEKDLIAQIDEVNQAHRQLGQSIGLSGISLQRTLHADRRVLQRPESWEQWPRPFPKRPRRSQQFSMAIMLVVVAVLTAALTVILQQRLLNERAAAALPPLDTRPQVASPVPLALSSATAQPATLKSHPAATVPALPAAAPAATAAATASSATPSAPGLAPIVVHLRAKRDCRLRLTLDGTALDWRDFKDGDELVSHFQEDIILETNDGGAIEATINGKTARIGEDRQSARFQLDKEKLDRDR